MSSEGSRSSSSSRLSQFGIYRSIDARTEEFLRLSRKRQIRQGCACAVISTVVTVTIVVGVLFVFKHIIGLDSNSSLNSRLSNWNSIFNVTSPFEEKYNKAKLNIDPTTLKLLPIVLKDLNQNRNLEKFAEESNSNTPVDYNKISVNEFSEKRSIFSSPKIKENQGPRLADYKLSPYNNPLNNLLNYKRSKHKSDPQRMLKYFNKMINEHKAAASCSSESIDKQSYIRNTESDHSDTNESDLELSFLHFNKTLQNRKNDNINSQTKPKSLLQKKIVIKTAETNKTDTKRDATSDMSQWHKQNKISQNFVRKRIKPVTNINSTNILQHNKDKPATQLINPKTAAEKNQTKQLTEYPFNFKGDKNILISPKQRSIQHTMQLYHSPPTLQNTVRRVEKSNIKSNSKNNDKINSLTKTSKPHSTLNMVTPWNLHKVLKPTRENNSKTQNVRVSENTGFNCKCIKKIKHLLYKMMTDLGHMLSEIELYKTFCGDNNYDNNALSYKDRKVPAILTQPKKKLNAIIKLPKHFFVSKTLLPFYNQSEKNKKQNNTISLSNLAKTQIATQTNKNNLKRTTMDQSINQGYAMMTSTKNLLKSTDFSGSQDRGQLGLDTTTTRIFLEPPPQYEILRRKIAPTQPMFFNKINLSQNINVMPLTTRKYMNTIHTTTIRAETTSIIDQENKVVKSNLTLTIKQVPHSNRDHLITVKPKSNIDTDLDVFKTNSKFLEIKPKPQPKTHHNIFIPPWFMRQSQNTEHTDDDVNLGQINTITKSLQRTESSQYVIDKITSPTEAHAKKKTIENVYPSEHKDTNVSQITIKDHSKEESQEKINTKSIIGYGLNDWLKPIITVSESTTKLKYLSRNNDNKQVNESSITPFYEILGLSKHSKSKQKHFNESISNEVMLKSHSHPPFNIKQNYEGIFEGFYDKNVKQSTRNTQLFANLGVNQNMKQDAEDTEIFDEFTTRKEQNTQILKSKPILEQIGNDYKKNMKIEATEHVNNKKKNSDNLGYTEMLITDFEEDEVIPWFMVHNSNTSLSQENTSKKYEDNSTILQNSASKQRTDKMFSKFADVNALLYNTKNISNSSIYKNNNLKKVNITSLSTEFKFNSDEIREKETELKAYDIAKYGNNQFGELKRFNPSMIPSYRPTFLYIQRSDFKHDHMTEQHDFDNSDNTFDFN